MRNLSEREKEIIKNILFRSEERNCDWVDLSCIYLHIFWNNKVSYESGTLYLPYENINDEDSIKFQRKFFETTILLKQLEENRYIHILEKSMDSNKIKGSHICSDKPLPKGCTIKLSSEISKIFDDANNKQLFVSQRLRTLVENDFKTYEDIQLEEAQKQTKASHESLEEARKQTESASASLAEAQKQTGKAKTQTYLSITAVVLSGLAIIASIFVPRCTPSTLDQKQFDTIQMKQDELIKTLNEIKNIQITNDSLIKELNLANESINEISNTLKEVKELNSKRK